MFQGKTHQLKCFAEYLDRIQSGQKTFEIRKNDRDFQVGDELVLVEFKNKTREDILYPSCGREIRVRVVYMTNFEQKPGYVVMGIEIEKDEP